MLNQWIKEQQSALVELGTDSESPVTSLAEAVQQELGAEKVRLSTTPRFSHASLGAAESANSTSSGAFRTWLSCLQDEYPQSALDTSHTLSTWLPRHIAFLANRFKQSKGATAYLLCTGREYTSSLVPFGETVMAKLIDIEHASKAKPRWNKAVWVGRMESNDAHVLLTPTGMQTARSVRRIAPPDNY